MIWNLHHCYIDCPRNSKFCRFFFFLFFFLKRKIGWFSFGLFPPFNFTRQPLSIWILQMVNKWYAFFIVACKYLFIYENISVVIVWCVHVRITESEQNSTQVMRFNFVRTTNMKSSSCDFWKPICIYNIHLFIYFSEISKYYLNIFLFSLFHASTLRLMFIFIYPLSSPSSSISLFFMLDCGFWASATATIIGRWSMGEAHI